MKVQFGFLSLVFILSFVFFGCVKGSKTNNPDDPWRDVVNIAEKSVVKILVNETNPVTDEIELVGHGSGAVVSRDGIIVTAAHVLEMYDELYKPVFIVEFKNKSLYTATFLKWSDKHDVGFLKITLDTKDIKVPFCKENAKIGEPVMAVGHAYPFVLWFSDGIVSAYQSFDGAMGRGDDDAEWMILTAPVNPGVSGGPIFTRSGCIAGVVSAMSRMHNEVYFAVPGPYAKKEIERLISKK